MPEAADAPGAELQITGTRDVLVDAVRRQLMGDVPIGVFLSGGLDSSLVAAIAAQVLAERGEQLQTFAVGTPGSPDLEAARRVAEHIDSLHRETTYTAEDDGLAQGWLALIVRVAGPAVS